MMDIEKLKLSVEKIKMQEESKKKIEEKYIEEVQKKNEGALFINPRPKNSRKMLRLCVAAVLILCSATAVMAGSGTFRNPSIVKDRDEIKEIESSKGESAGYAVSGPNSRTPHTLEEMTESCRFKSSGWSSNETIGGSVWNHYNWIDMEVIDNEGDLKERNVYSDKKDIKKEYTAENPLLLQEFMKGETYIDLAKLNELYNYVPDANVLYYVEDKKGNYVELCFDSLYADSEEKSYFSLVYWHHSEEDKDNFNEYIPESSYDEVYEYTNADGAEFIIQTYGGCVWATCNTEHSYIGLYGGYMQTDEIEEVLDCIKFEAVD